MGISKIIFFFIFFPGIFLSQNLMSNGDFEEYTELPFVTGKFNYAKGWKNLNANNSGKCGSPDYFNALHPYKNYFAEITPPSGTGQMGLATYHETLKNFREYISAALKSPMRPGEKYVVSFYLSNGKDNLYEYTTANFGVYFSANQPQQNLDQPILVKPDYEYNSLKYIYDRWEKVSFTYTADTVIRFITFGNFRNDTNTTVSPKGKSGAYYFIDKIEVIPQKKGDPEIIATTQKDSVLFSDAINQEVLEQKFDDTKPKAKNLPVKEAAKIGIK